jgi:uncharacterized glyoxalase superfamily protein PhnB
MFLVDKVDEATSWYQDILGAKLQYSVPKTPPYQWVLLLLDSIEIMIAQKGIVQQWYTDKVPTSEKPSNFIAYFYVKDVDALYNRVKSKVEIIMHPADQPHGIREFAIQDSFGFVLIFAQIIK